MSNSILPNNYVVQPCFKLNEKTKKKLQHKTPSFGFNGLGELVYYRTYSRIKSDGNQETWYDTVLRVVEGAFSIRKYHNQKNFLPWNEEDMQKYADGFAQSLFDMHWLAPGRGLFACGTEFMYQRGSAALNNCGACSTVNLSEACRWICDALMCGIGVGFDTFWKPEHVYTCIPNKTDTELYIIPDSREGWVESVYRLVKFYETNGSIKFPVFDYSLIRPAGVPIRGFGGTASGYLPLKKLHSRIVCFFECFIQSSINPTSEAVRHNVQEMLDKLKSMGTFEAHEDVEQLKQTTQTTVYDSVRLVADIINAIGCMVVAGNVRRSAQIALGNCEGTFSELKNYTKSPERASLGWMSNNTVLLKEKEDFNHIPQLVERIVANGEPGFLNLINTQAFGRIGRKPYNPSEPWTREYEKDKATLVNPCSEIPLESFELCCIVEVFPTRCTTNDSSEKFNSELFYKAVEYATFYVSTISLCPTHWEQTNAVIARNHRVGVSLSGIAEFYSQLPFTEFITHLRKGYKLVRETNTKLANEAGVAPSIRVTTVKPSGTISLLAGTSPGLHYPSFSYCIRRVRVGEMTPIAKVLVQSGIPYEKDVYSDNTLVFSFPLDQSQARPATSLSVWEQFSMLCTMQREWSDNSVSVTIYFDKENESNILEHALAQNMPSVKSVSLLPHSNKGCYKQSPYEGITKEEYEKLIKTHPIIDWKQFTDSDGINERFCTNDSCSY
jgi:ribonucleoside-diphosphate reductase alpha chain